MPSIILSFGSWRLVGDNAEVTITAERAADRVDKPDAVCLAAVDVARSAVGDDVAVGAHVGVEVDGERVLTHLFECLDKGYVGWRWGVQVVRASRAKVVTVNDVCKLPGPDALVAPPWVPWAERLRPGDLGVGDLLPADPDDDRLALALEMTDDDTPLIEWGLGRPRVLSYEGRAEAADRWYVGDSGPGSPHARHAPAHCGTCGFYAPLAGALGQGFGACANEFAPDDGRVVAVDHGCGAHSEGSPELDAMGAAPALVDEFSFEIVAVADDESPAEDAVETEPPAEDAVETEPPTEDADPAEPADADA